MQTIKFDRFTDPLFLRQLGRPLLERLLARFKPELKASGVLLPPPTALDEEFFNLVAFLLMSPEKLPQELGEAVHNINLMATPEGQQRIEQTLAQAGARLEIQPDSSHADIALQVYLTDPALLAKARNMHRLTRFCTFHHFGPRAGMTSKHGRRLQYEPGINAAEAECDTWFAAHSRGRHNTRVEVHVLPESGLPDCCEYWFLVLHGDTFARSARIESGKLDVLHFRPARDDLVVYNPRRNEIRINARTIGERSLYRAVFGRLLFGDPEFFAERKTYTLAPLQQEGEGALDVRGINGLEKVLLRDYEIAVPDAFGQRTLHKASDIFAAAEFYKLTPPISAPGDLIRATFDVYFEQASLPRSVQVRPPNTLRTSRHTDVRPIEEWLTLNRFRISTS